MKKSKLVLSTAAALAASCAIAGPIVLPSGPLYIHFDNAEQISPSNSLPGATGGVANRGIIEISTIVKGTVLPPTGSDIATGLGNVFINGLGPQVLGLFQINSFVAGSGLTHATGGFVDLYWFDSSAQSTGVELLANNTGKFNANSTTYTGFTCTTAEANSPGCTFLGRLDFVSGAAPGFPGVSTTTTVDPTNADGTSHSYLSVDTGVTGAWSAQLNTNFFTLDPLNIPVGTNYPPNTPIVGAPGGISYPAAADVRLDNNFDHNGGTAWTIAGTDFIGLRSNDPARAFAVPEPGSLGLLGLALAGLGAMKRRWRRNA